MALKQMIVGSSREGMNLKTRGRSISRCLMGLIFSACLVAMPANAYVLEGPHVLELVVKTMDKVRSLRIVQKVTIGDSIHAKDALVLDETVTYLFPDRLRSETIHDKSHRIQVISLNQSLTIVDGKRTNEPVERPERYKNLLLCRSRLQMHKMLLTHGVDVEKSSLGRFEDKTVFVIGSQYPDESVSQVWVDKESFLPLRWLDIPVSDPNDRLEFLYRQWQKRGEVWYPLVVEIHHNGRLTRQIEVADIVMNPSVQMELFDIPYLTTIYPLMEAVEPTEPAGTSPADEVKRTIEEFQKKFDE